MLPAFPHPPSIEAVTVQGGKSESAKGARDAMRAERALVVGFLVAVTVSCTHRTTDTVLILHTNDIHGHIREGADGVGGMARVGGYIRDVKAKRSDTLVVDAGDINNKGDMLPGVTRGRALYEIMGLIGYDAAAPGNHDFVYGMEHLQNLVRWGGFPSLCLNALDEVGNPVLAASQVFDVDGVRVGVIGVTVQRGKGTLSLDDTCPLLAQEAERLEPDAHLIVAVCHLSSSQCAEASRAVPGIDVFVGGHSHEALHEPVIVEETGALVIEAGDFARYVGRLEVKIDLDTEEIVGYKGKLVSTKGKSVRCDPELRAWIAEQEREACPQVADEVGTCQQEVTRRGMAKLLAAALLDTGGADVAFARTGTFSRGLPTGTISFNTLYRTFRLGEQPAVVVDLKGQDILAYLEQAARANEVSQWAGFMADMSFEAPDKRGKVITTSLDPNRTYRAMFPEDEARGVFARFGVEGHELKPCAFTLSEILLPYMARIGQSGNTLNDAVVPKPVLVVPSGG
jgi:5'-nucleotidase / UDP-sugar diphosphatase